MKKIALIRKKAKNFNENVDKSMNGRRLSAWISECYCYARFGCSPDDYFRYQFYKKSNLERDKFITYRRSQKIIKKYNNPQYISLFRDKREFNKLFADFLKREWVDLGTTTEDEFVSFVKKHGSVMMKPLSGGQGRGVYKMSADKLVALNYQEYGQFIAEELLVQHPDMASLNPSSVNTVRVLTFKGNIITCALKIGGVGSDVDNFHLSNGICAHLDKDKGVIDVCIDNAMNKYIDHPITGKRLLGFTVPYWNLIISTVTKAAQVVPEVAYVGWDVAVLKDDVAIIEGNHDPGHDIVQMVAQKGLYEDIIEATRAMSK